MKHVVPLLAAALVLGSLLGSQARADDEKKVGWFDTAELGFVATSGNSNTTTLGFKNLTKRAWDAAEWTLELGTVYSRSRAGDRFGVGAPGEGNFAVKDPPQKTDAERLYGKTGYGQKINPHVFWEATAGAERNRPAGIEHSYTLGGGLGNIWVDSERVRFRTAYTVTYTNEHFVAGERQDFPGFRLSYTYQNKLTSTTTFDSEIAFDDSFDDLDDHRTDWYNAVRVSMTEQIALKAGLRLLYRNIPPLEEITIYDADPNQGAANAVGTALVEKENLDTNFTTSLVIDF